MTWIDLLLQRWRIRMALRELPVGVRLLDVGTHDGAVFRHARTGGVGIDPALRREGAVPGDVVLVEGAFPVAISSEADASFDAATALAVVEHVPESELAEWSDALARLIRPGGLFVVTVPAPAVDRILHVLMRLRLVAGMEAHQHHGFEPHDVPRYFPPPCWELVKHRRFQLGLNNLFVLRRAAASESDH